MLSYDDYTILNESVRSEIFKNGMCVMYSASGKNIEYYTYLCLTDKDDIDEAIDDLTWKSDISESDILDMKNDKYGILITSRETGTEYVLISDILVNNIMYIWNTHLKLDDCIKDKYLTDLSDKCKPDKLIYEKDVDFSKIVTMLPDEPFFDYQRYKDEWYGDSGGYDTWTTRQKTNDLGSFTEPSSINI